MRRFIVVVLLCIYLMPAASLARSSARSSARASKAHTRPADPVYTSALAAANRFLQAWQTQDHETGIMMLSDSARQHSSPELLDTFFSHTQAAYEVGQGRKMKEGTYAFPVVLFVMNSSKPRRCVLLVTRGGNDKDDWAIDKLP